MFEKNDVRTKKQPIKTMSILLTIVFGALPFILFFIDTATGNLSLGDVYDGNHGPWRTLWQGYTIGLPMVFVIINTVVGGIFCSVQEKSWNPILFSLGLILVQTLITIIQLITLIHLVD